MWFFSRLLLNTPWFREIVANLALVWSNFVLDSPQKIRIFVYINARCSFCPQFWTHSKSAVQNNFMFNPLKFCHKVIDIFFYSYFSDYFTLALILKIFVFSRFCDNFRIDFFLQNMFYFTSSTCFILGSLKLEKIRAKSSYHVFLFLFPEGSLTKQTQWFHLSPHFILFG